jgi:F0F1-type ATP synthase delta subunit
MASRMQVAAYVADRLERERTGALRSAAAWLQAHGQARQAPYLARDIAQVLAARGYVVARVTTARPLGAQARERVQAFVAEATGARTVELETAVEPGMIGGVRLEVPGRALDASVRAKLDRYVADAIMTTGDVMEANS